GGLLREFPLQEFAHLGRVGELLQAAPVPLASEWRAVFSLVAHESRFPVTGDTRNSRCGCGRGTPGPAPGPWAGPPPAPDRPSGRWLPWGRGIFPAGGDIPGTTPSATTRSYRSAASDPRARGR